MAKYTATSKPILVSSANKHRVSITFFNPNAVQVFIGKYTDIKADGTGNTLPLQPNGGSIIEGPPKTYLGDFYIISSGADNDIFVFETNDSETGA